jgi:hypothetical protein
MSIMMYWLYLFDCNALAITLIKIYQNTKYDCAQRKVRKLES